VRSYAIATLGEHVVARIRRELFAHLVELSPAFYDQNRTGEIISRMTTDTTLLQAVVGNTITFALRNFLLLVGGLVMLVVTSLKLTSLVLGVIPLVVIPIIWLGKKVRKLSREAQSSVAEISIEVEESLNAIRMIQAYGLEPNRTSRLNKAANHALDVATQRIATRSALTTVVISLVFGAVATVLWVGGREVIQGSISPGDLSAFIFYSVVVAAGVGAISEVIGDLQRAAGAAERIFELLRTPSPLPKPTQTAPTPDIRQGVIRLSDVVFTYPTRTGQPSLQGINLEIKPGERVALVGPSGAGKSTIFHLLLRFYDPDSGSICLDGRPLAEWPLDILRAHYALVPQDPVIFSANGWENIRAGRPGASDEEVLEAAKAAQAHEFLSALPEGYDSYLGEKGVRLSGGQRQRVALARAFLRNPPILLLDEATSALDAENEQQVQEALHRIMQGRTTLVIAHRLATIRECDRILVLDQGKLVAEGNHQSLMAEGGLYARLAQLQFHT
jgi:ATP-binding cassette subfamily B protein